VGELYDTIGRSYAATRRADPRIAAAIHDALGDARTVLNVGAGTGAYEPPGREVTAVEPSAIMRARRATPAIDAHAEALPFPDGAFDASMAVLSDHHWTDRPKGLRELRRVARRSVVFTFDASWFGRSWVARDYLPEIGTLAGLTLDAIAEHLGATEIRHVPVPHDCHDGFLHSYWRRPEAYLDPVVRANISVFPLIGEEATARFVQALRHDLETGAWHERNAGLLELDELDLGYRLLVAE
jgi:SAM-dependent methyltransferase